MTPEEETPMVAMAAPPVNPAELLRSVDLWLVNRAVRAARFLGLEWEDVLQEFRVRVFLHAHSYDPDRGKATTWATAVCRSAVNRILEARRRQAWALGNSSGTDSALELHPDSRLPPPDEQVEAADNATAVQELLGGLDPQLARAVALRFGIGGAGEVVGEELGRRLGVSRSAAFQMVRAGLDAIRGKTALLTW